MARNKKGILGGFSGKVGTVVGYNLNGEEFMRSLPDRKAPPTEKELINMAAFGLVQENLSYLKEFLQVSFKGYGSKTGGSRGALSYNRKHAVGIENGIPHIIPEQFKASGGPLAGAVNPAVVMESPGLLRFHWETGHSPNSSPKDQVLLLAINFETRASAYVCIGAFRDSGTEVLRLTADLMGKEIHTYIGFVSPGRTHQSDSQYIGIV